MDPLKLYATDAKYSVPRPKSVHSKGVTTPCFLLFYLNPNNDGRPLTRTNDLAL